MASVPSAITPITTIRLVPDNGLGVPPNLPPPHRSSGWKTARYSGTAKTMVINAATKTA